jgi:hypothetical protein
MAFVGIGTGRCGTVTLAHIVKACRTTMVSHEHPGYSPPWQGDATPAIASFIRHARAADRNGRVMGEVALYWLPHVERLRASLPELKVICLKRDKEATIASMMRKVPGYTLVRPEDRAHNPEWWDLFPTIEAPTIESAWSRYYDFYYEQAGQLENVLHVRTEDLDHDETAVAIFDYLEIPESDRAYPDHRRHNTGEETGIAWSRLGSAAAELGRAD